MQMTVSIIFKASTVNSNFIEENLPMITVFLSKIKNSKCTFPNYYAQQTFKTFDRLLRTKNGFVEFGA